MKNLLDSFGRPPGRMTYFQDFRDVGYTTEEIRFFQRAYAFAKHAHSKQIRDDGSRYFDHPKRVAYVLGVKYRIHHFGMMLDAILHDVVEDSFLLSRRCLIDNFGLTRADNNRALTKIERESTEHNNDRVLKRGYVPGFVKVADRRDNMGTLAGCSQEKQERITEETLTCFLGKRGMIARVFELTPPILHNVLKSMSADIEELCGR